MSERELRLALPARAANVIVVRQAVAGLGESLGMSPHRVNDLKTVVTEACNNVVLYAYEQEEGPMEVSALADADAVELSVRDHGGGFRPTPDIDGERSLGLGLPLIAALSDSFEIRGARGEGTTMLMRFALREQAQGSGNGSGEGAAAARTEQGLEMRITPGPEVRPVLARVIAALATRAEFSIDRISDTFLLGDAVSAQGPEEFEHGCVEIEISDGDGSLGLRVGPLIEGGGERILAQLEIPDAGGSLRGLARSTQVITDTADDGSVREFLSFEVVS